MKSLSSSHVFDCKAPALFCRGVARSVSGEKKHRVLKRADSGESFFFVPRMETRNLKTRGIKKLTKIVRFSRKELNENGFRQFLSLAILKI
ncbi:hypothetical protein CH380_10735 [Leptospira adleri]|uniref:Uncharacterized protein n=1 Tax=Leptospira adleri TaxID=2023186 RepID=A0A2M9YP02_9LEPT|nr:hypothetical protein CH380_10735 [Leptospira adleri]PJZ63918.1 hypothetical protein CH376_00375 [Leptospira adleri]